MSRWRHFQTLLWGIPAGLFVGVFVALRMMVLYRGLLLKSTSSIVILFPQLSCFYGGYVLGCIVVLRRFFRELLWMLTV